MKKLVLVLTILLVTPAHADTVTIGWWDKSIGGPVTTLSATSGPITATSPIVQIVQNPISLGSGFGFDQIIAMVIPPSGNVLSGGLGVAGPTFEFSFNDGFAPPQGGNAEIIIVDCSGSMDYPPTKMTEARAATAAAVDVIRDGTSFAIVAGTSTAWPVYPADGSMAVAGERTRTEYAKVLGTDHPDTLTACVNLAHAYYGVGRITDAARLLQETVERCELALPPGHSLTAAARDSLANISGTG